MLSPRWLGGLAAALALAAVMTLLGQWQLSRYHERSETNARIDAAEQEDAPGGAPLATVVEPPRADAPTGPPPGDDAEWTLATVTGEYDTAHEILVRNRTLQGRVGVAVLTPLVRADGTAVLVNRGWVPPAESGLKDRPDVPAPPAGQATVTGWVRGSERPAGLQERDGDLYTRRIAVDEIAGQLPYPLFGTYLTRSTQQPAASADLTPVPPRRENAWLNAGYTAQWWIFAAMVLVGYGWLAHREAGRRTTTGAGAGTTGAGQAG